MDQQLKQRLVGVTIVVALVVIFVPMLFDRSEDKGKLSTAGIPPIPEEVLEKPLELPKSPEDLAPKQAEEGQEGQEGQDGQKKGKEKAPVETGYKMVPLNDEAPPEAEARPAVAEEEEDPVERQGGEEGATAEPSPQATREDRPAQTALPPVQALPVKSESARHLAEPKPVAAPKKTVVIAPKPQQAAAEPRKATEEVAKPKPVVNTRTVQTVTGKPEAARPPETRRPVLKTVKVDKSKPAVPAAAGLDDEDLPIPAKTGTLAAKPKPVAATAPKPVAVKKPDAPKPAEPINHALAAKPEKPAEPVAAGQPPAKPAPHPAKPQAKKPPSWVVQAGSFTDEAAARGLAEKLKQSKFPASVRAVQGEHGSVYRVQVGAEHERGRAEETLKQIEGSVGISGIVTQRH